ncbi:MAG: 30S ribosomal protein S18 [Chloroflexi bacterium]|nr:30S ribosomal protein S18 [Chloroflexota bacterium]
MVRENNPSPAPGDPPAGPAAPAAGPGFGPRGRGRPRGRYAPRRKVCAFCADKVDDIDYKDVGRLRRFISDRGKIEPRRKTGTCARHQRILTLAIKRARHLALLPFTAEHIREMGGLPPIGPAQAPVPTQPATVAPAAPPEPAEAAAERSSSPG